MHIEDVHGKLPVRAVIGEPELHLVEVFDEVRAREQTADRKLEAGVSLLDTGVWDRALVSVVVRRAHRRQLVRGEEIRLAAPGFVRLIGVFQRVQDPHADLRLRPLRNVQGRRVNVLVRAVPRRHLIECLRVERVACRV